MQVSDYHLICKSSLSTIPDFISGTVFLIDKPIGWTSFDVVNKLRHTLKHKLGIKKIKVGHAGTLDPNATGLLIVCTGKMTKSIDLFQAQEKVYSGTFVFGATTPTYDSESEPNHFFPQDHITLMGVEEAIKQFIGLIMQVPPIYSALKIDGKSAHVMARKGIEVEMKARPVEIFDFKVDISESSEWNYFVHCSKGTYIRSLIHDLGKTMQSGAYIKSLRRLKSGDFDTAQALSIDEACEYIQNI